MGQLHAEGRKALCIGNANYQVTPLTNPVNDAGDMAKALTECGRDATVVLNADRQAMETAVRNLCSRLEPCDYALFFYAGHGIQSDGQNYLVPVDNGGIDQEADLKYKSIAASWVMDCLSARNTKANIMILDACRDNPLKTRALGSRGGNRGLAVMGSTESENMIVFAAGDGQTAADGVERNGLFTSVLLKHLHEPGIAAVDVLLYKVKPEVTEAAKKTGKKQEPWVYVNIHHPFQF
jgi:uncharacterized caspase-like protein